MGRELVVRNFHKDSFRFQNNRGPYLCNNPVGPVCHPKARLDADQPHPREDRDILGLRDLRIFQHESAAWKVSVGSVENLIDFDSRSVGETDVPFLQA